MNNKGLFLSILLVVCASIFLALTREYWQALAKYIFFGLIAVIIIRPLGLYLGEVLRRMVEKNKSNMP